MAHKSLASKLPYMKVTFDESRILIWFIFMRTLKFCISLSDPQIMKYYTKRSTPKISCSQCLSFCFLQYLDNILQNPTEEKFRKIRKSNKAFQERVASQEGTDMFLEACGFKTQSLDGEDFWVYSSQIDSETIQMVRVFCEINFANQRFNTHKQGIFDPVDKAKICFKTFLVFFTKNRCKHILAFST